MQTGHPWQISCLRRYCGQINILTHAAFKRFMPGALVNLVSGQQPFPDASLNYSIGLNCIKA